MNITETMPWVSLGVALFALYHSVRKDKLQQKVDKIRQRGELRKKVVVLELDVIPRFKRFYEQAESKCQSCKSFYKGDYELIGQHLADLKNWTDNLGKEIKKPIIRQNIAYVEECLSLINLSEQLLAHFEKVFQKRIDCTDKREMNLLD
jgi:hypothetical protein